MCAYSCGEDRKLSIAALQPCRDCSAAAADSLPLRVEGIAISVLNLARRKIDGWANGRRPGAAHFLQRPGLSIRADPPREIAVGGDGSWLGSVMAKGESNTVGQGSPGPGEPRTGQENVDAKKKRLAEALRENLKRRKAQAQLRKNKS
jgi:hypothetical protein